MGSRRSRRRNFSIFSLDDAIKEVSIKKLMPWFVEADPIELSDLFKAILDRLKQFNTQSNERGRELIIDAILAEAIVSLKHLKIWKGAPLNSDELNGEADYLITDDKDYLESPFLCVVEAKKDDFEKGLAKCLVEMKVCWLNNLDLGRKIEVLGIVTNGAG